MKISSVGICVFFVAFAAFSAKVKRDVARNEALASFSESVSYGVPPPGFELGALDGETYRLEDQITGRKIVLISFWATWCPPCRLEMPQLESLYERYRDSGLQVLAINVGEDGDTVQKFVDKRTLSFPVLLDRDGLVSTRYHVEAFPTTVLIDSDGKVLEVTEGLHPYLAYGIESQLDDKSEDEP